MTQKSPSLAQIIAASSVGTMIEFYDFFIFASLAPVLATQFYPPSDPNVGFFSTLLTLAVGVAVRPIGSLIFGRVGDTVGRKTTSVTLGGLRTSTRSAAPSCSWGR